MKQASSNPSQSEPAEDTVVETLMLKSDALNATMAPATTETTTSNLVTPSATGSPEATDEALAEADLLDALSLGLLAGF